MAPSLLPAQLAPIVLSARGERVLLDVDLAHLYGVETKRLNEAVKRNRERFPEDFMFQLTDNEIDALRSQIATSSSARSQLDAQFTRQHGGRRGRPYVFTEQGVAMLSSVLRSPRAIEVNIAIMRTFVQLRRLMDSNKLLAEKIEELERKYEEHDHNFALVFDAIRKLIAAEDQPIREIGFHTAG